MITSAFRKRWGRTLNEQWYDLPQQARIPSPDPPILLSAERANFGTSKAPPVGTS